MVVYKNIEDRIVKNIEEETGIRVEYSDEDARSENVNNHYRVTFENEYDGDIKSEREIDRREKILSYEDSRRVINDIVADLFKNILTIEERSLRQRGIKDLSMSEIHALEAIGTGDGRMMSEVADTLDITMGTLTTTISKLESKGYAKREKDPNDRRVVIASLTRKGILVDKIHRHFHEEMIDHLMIDLKLDENQALINALMNINDFFLKEYGGEHEV